MNNKNEVVILCGGMGSRLAEETTIRPKPMVEIGGLPILVHIMKHYSNHGYNKFILALGYKSDYIKQYFYNYKISRCDFTTTLNPNSKIKYVKKNDDPRDYRVNCDKIKNELGFKISMTVPDGIMEIKRVIQENLIQDPENQKYYNIPHERK